MRCYLPQQFRSDQWLSPSIFRIEHVQCAAHEIHHCYILMVYRLIKRDPPRRLRAFQNRGSWKAFSSVDAGCSLGLCARLCLLAATKHRILLMQSTLCRGQSRLQQWILHACDEQSHEASLLQPSCEQMCRTLNSLVMVAVSVCIWRPPPQIKIGESGRKDFVLHSCSNVSGGGRHFFFKSSYSDPL